MTHMSLRGERGVFQEFDSPEPDDPHRSESLEVEDKEEGSEIVVALRTYVNQLRRELGNKRANYREMWRLNCEQLAKMDILLAEKEEENTCLEG